MEQVRLSIIADKAVIHNYATILDSLFEELGYPIALIECDNSWMWSIYVPTDQANEAQSLIHSALEGDIDILLDSIPVQDWVEASLRNLPPIRAGRFYIHGSHDSHSAQSQKFPILIDASMAFGTGHHETTIGCLKMLDKVIDYDTITHIYDIGTGSGILSIAASLCDIESVLATDNDPIALKIAEQNAKLNNVSHKIDFHLAKSFDGFNHSCFKKADLIMANILSNPLISMANDLCSHLSTGGYIILSGILSSQRAGVLTAYDAKIIDSIEKDDWCTLLLRKES